MTRTLYLAMVALLSSLPAFGQQNQAAALPCPATEKAILEVEHQLWSAPRTRDAAALDKLTDERFISTDDNGVRIGKRELLAHYRQPEGKIHNETDEQPAGIRLVFTNGVAILNFTKHGTEYDREVGVSFVFSSVITRVFTCSNGEWKLVVFHETAIPNKDREPSSVAANQLDDYVGRYRFVEKGAKGDISVVRKGAKLFETWSGDEKPTEILPGKYDTFFTREDSVVERFIRDKSGKVSGILYTLIDGEHEAKRLP